MARLPPTGTPQARGTGRARTWHCRGGSTPSRTARRSARRPGPRRPAGRSPAAAAGAPPWCGAPGPSCAPAPPSPPRAPLPRVTNPKPPRRALTAAPSQTLGPGHIKSGRTEARSGGRRGSWLGFGGWWGFLSLPSAASPLPFSVASSRANFFPFSFLPFGRWGGLGFFCC